MNSVADDLIGQHEFYWTQDNILLPNKAASNPLVGSPSVQVKWT